MLFFFGRERGYIQRSERNIAFKEPSSLSSASPSIGVATPSVIPVYDTQDLPPHMGIADED